MTKDKPPLARLPATAAPRPVFFQVDEDDADEIEGQKEADESVRLKLCEMLTTWISPN